MTYEALDIFEHLQASEVQWLLASAEFKTVEPHTYLLREGDPPANIFFVADGLFEVSVYSGEGTIIKVGRLGPGDVIGEISWLDRKSASGSVKAIETGMVMCLHTAALDAKLEADPVFAAHFLRGVATLVVQRLRRTTSEFRASQAAGAAVPGGQKATPIAQSIADFKASADALLARAGSDGDEAKSARAGELRAAFASLQREVGSAAGANLQPGIAEAIRQELRAYLSVSAIGARCIARPRGYAGDFATIDMIYAGQPGGTNPLGLHIDKCLLDMAGLKGIGSRLHMIADALRAEVQQVSEPLLVTNLGSGAAPEVFDLLSGKDVRERLQVTCIDVDREAVAVLEEKIDRTGSKRQISAIHANLIHLATGRDEVDLEPQHVIYSAGLLDSLKDDAAVVLINWMFRKLRPGGKMIIGSLSPDDPSRGLMENALDWPLNHRDEAELSALVKASEFAAARVQHLHDRDTPGYLAVIVKA